MSIGTVTTMDKFINNDDIIFHFALNLPLSELLNYCLISKKISGVLSNEHFWRLKVTTMFPSQGKICTWKNTYHVITHKVYIFGDTASFTDIINYKDRIIYNPTLIDSLKYKLHNSDICDIGFTIISDEDKIYFVGYNKKDCPYDLKKYFKQKEITCVSSSCKKRENNFYHTAIIVDEQLYTFGNNSSGQCGYITTLLNEEKKKEPCLVEFFKNMKVTNVSCGECNTAVVADNQLYTFGLDRYGVLGHGSNGGRGHEYVLSFPKRVMEFENMKVTNVFCGYYHTAVVADNKLYTFGFGSHGALGHEDKDNCTYPKLVECLHDVISVSGGPNYTVVIARQM
jgi:alpha-tubulin suppressor-like RCC1 family protein